MTPRAHRFTKEVVRRIDWPCLEFTPDAPPPSAGWPLLLFLHGAGEKGDDGAALPRSALPRLIARGLAIDALVVCPQCPPGPGWPVADLSALLDTLIARDNVDPTRVHLAGISMGARGAWDLAYARAAALASIVAVCGIGVPTLAPLVAAVPAMLVHGAADDVVPATRSAEMAAALTAAGGEAWYRELAGVGHDCGDAVFGDPALWSWVLKQRKDDGESR